MWDEKPEAGSVYTKGCAGGAALMEAIKQSREKLKLVKKKEENYEADVSGEA